MNKRNRNRNGKASLAKPSSPAAIQPTSLTPALPPPVEKPTLVVRGKNAVYFMFRERTLGVFAILVASASAYYTYRQHAGTQEQIRITKLSNDRATGKTTARLQYADYYPLPQEFPKDQFVRLETAPDGRPYFKDLKNFVDLAPTLWVNNLGDEVLESVKIETSPLRNALFTTSGSLVPANDPKQKVELFKVESPLIVKAVEREELQLARQCGSGEAFRVSLIKGLLSQMMQSQTGIRSKDAPAKLNAKMVQYGTFDVIVSGKLAGNSFYTSEGDQLWVKLAWMPDGFPPDQCKKFLDEYTQRVDVSKAVPVKIPKWSEK